MQTNLPTVAAAIALAVSLLAVPTASAQETSQASLVLDIELAGASQTVGGYVLVTDAGDVFVYQETNGCEGLQEGPTSTCAPDEQLFPGNGDTPGAPDVPGAPQPPELPGIPGFPGAPDPGQPPSIPDPEGPAVPEPPSVPPPDLPEVPSLP